MYNVSEYRQCITYQSIPFLKNKSWQRRGYEWNRTQSIGEIFYKVQKIRIEERREVSKQMKNDIEGQKSTRSWKAMRLNYMKKKYGYIYIYIYIYVCVHVCACVCARLCVRVEYINMLDISCEEYLDEEEGALQADKPKFCRWQCHGDCEAFNILRWDERICSRRGV